MMKKNWRAKWSFIQKSPAYREMKGTIVLSEMIFSFSFVFLSSILIGASMYVIGSVIAPKCEKTADKLAPYACGEDMPGRKFQVDMQRFFLYIACFMIFDISAFMLALAFVGRGLYPILFSAIVGLSLLIVGPVIGRGKK